MMEAEDTVMSDTDVKNFIGYWDTEHAEEIRLIKTRQARISFKAGYEQCYKDDTGTLEDVKKAGIKEVVERLGQFTEGDIYGDKNTGDYILFQMPYKYWQALLEEVK